MVLRTIPALCTLIVDAEEDFDWDHPVQGTVYTTEHIRHINVLHDILDSYSATPTYLLTYPVLDDADAVRVLRREYDRGRCDLGIQLHPWVTPPFEDGTERQESYSGNLGAGLEERKLLCLIARFEAVFGRRPVVYRAGRYGLGRRTGALLEELGFRVDTSIAPRTDFSSEGGPDYRHIDCNPFWFGTERRLLEVPLCRSIIGWSGTLAPAVYRATAGNRKDGARALGILTRARCVERITLSPEGNDFNAMRRLALALMARGQRVFALSFHSSSLYPGRNPYVRTRADLHEFYDRLSAVLTFMAEMMRAEFVTTSHLPERLAPASRTGAPT